MFDGVCYDKLGVYLTNEPFDEIYNDDDHTPGLWAYSTKKCGIKLKGKAVSNRKLFMFATFWMMLS